MIGQLIGRAGRHFPETLKAALSRVAIACSRLMRPSGTFTFLGDEYPYFSHRYNLSWRNERTVEVPIALRALRSHAGDRVLEVGNVISHYFHVDHDVIDKYERGDTVMNVDVVDFEPDGRYDLILCISTLEHIGWDEEPRNPGKGGAALSRLAGFLSPAGELIATFPLGHNPGLDTMLREGTLPFTEVHALKRTSGRNTWSEIDADSVIGGAGGILEGRTLTLIVGRIKAAPL
jgi:hypothetical protein